MRRSVPQSKWRVIQNKNHLYLVGCRRDERVVAGMPLRCGLQDTLGKVCLRWRGSNVRGALLAMMSSRALLMAWISSGSNWGMAVARDIAVNRDVLRYPDVRRLILAAAAPPTEEPDKCRRT
jgi:hypothetical protein